VLGGCLALLAPIHAQETSLQQASFGGRSYVLVREDEGYALLENGREPVSLASQRREVFEAAAALDTGWLLAGYRAVENGPGSELVLLRGNEKGMKELPVPPSGSATAISPQPLVESGRLVGLVWLEGSDPSALGVRAAAWNGGGFTAAEWVSPALDGSQLALSGAVLADGSWLLVWSAFDGGDDEILWSRRDGTSWTAPARLHPDNQVPDITPVVAPTARGAVAAWSRYDGGAYRGRLMRFEADAGWRDEERLGGAGSVFPFFAVDDTKSGPLLVFREGVEGRWDLIELGGRGEVRSRTRWTGDPGRRPVVQVGAGGAARLEWVARGSAERSSTP
jgi:hypothetical protein